jgi:hypothetical protein
MPAHYHSSSKYSPTKTLTVDEQLAVTRKMVLDGLWDAYHMAKSEGDHRSVTRTLIQIAKIEGVCDVIDA